MVNAVSSLAMAAYICSDRDGLNVTTEECAGWANQAATVGPPPRRNAITIPRTAACSPATIDCKIVVCWWLSPCWGSCCRQILRVWFLDDATKMEPNLAYGQIMPSKKAPSAGHGGFIEWAHTPVLLDMVAILRSAAPEVWTHDDHAAFGEWLRKFLVTKNRHFFLPPRRACQRSFAHVHVSPTPSHPPPHTHTNTHTHIPNYPDHLPSLNVDAPSSQVWVDSKTAAGERNMANNHGTWYDSTWQAVALHAGNIPNASAAVDEVKHRRIDLQILWNGHEWIELERANNCGYCQ